MRPTFVALPLLAVVALAGCASNAELDKARADAAAAKAELGKVKAELEQLKARIPEQRPLEGDKVKARLIVIRGAKPNSDYPVYEGKNVIGRSDQKPVEIDLFAQEAADRVWSSRQHAVIVWENGSLSIEDLNSTNGTFVNRDRVQPGEKKSLKANDVIQIGEVHLKIAL